MAIQRIEQYQQANGVSILKVFLRPTAKFPNGYFYAPSEVIDLVQRYNWLLHQHGNRVYVEAHVGSGHYRKTIYFHKELFKFYHGYDWQDGIDHLNLIEYDNTDNNLNATSHQQNGFNRPTKGYIYNTDYGTFQPRIRIDSKEYHPFPVTHREDEACIKQNYSEQIILKEKLQDQYYMFNFLKYRRGSEDILDLERTGIISEEEAIYRHILRYKDNAWFYLRYSLEQYFKDYHIQVPKYSLDTEGFMVHPITGQRLCPF